MDFMRKLRSGYYPVVVIAFAAISFIALWLDRETGGMTNYKYFSVYASDWGDPLTWLRLFTHTLGHADLEHWSGNMLGFLVLGVTLERRYGSGLLLAMFAVVAAVTGLVNMIFFPDTILLGASGLVYMMILLSAIPTIKRGILPLNFILFAVLYVGQEIYAGLFVVDNISHLSHLIGAVFGCIFGLLLNKFRRRRRNKRSYNGSGWIY